MLKRKGILTVFTIAILGVIIVFSKMHLGATTQQDGAINIKHQLEQQDAQILKDKDTAGAIARSNAQMNHI